MTKTIFAALALAGTISATTAEAQLTPEAGVSAGALTRFYVEGTASPPQAELQANVSMPLTENWAAEALFSVSGATTVYERRLEGEYGATFKRYSTPDAATSPFFSIGLLGAYSHRSGRFGTTFSGYPPTTPTIGGGLRINVKTLLRLEARADFMLWMGYLYVPLPVPAAVRTFVGVAVPIRRSAP
jgi:hypothetical protein